MESSWDLCVCVESAGDLRVCVEISGDLWVYVESSRDCGAADRAPGNHHITHVRVSFLVLQQLLLSHHAPATDPNSSSHQFGNRCNYYFVVDPLSGVSRRVGSLQGNCHITTV